MTRTRMVCLANSWRPGGRCIAGVDLADGSWVRPILSTGKSIPEKYVRFGNKELAPLDIIEADLAPPDYKTRFQCENRIVLSDGFTLTGQKLWVTDVLKYCETSLPVLHGEKKTVAPSYLQGLEPRNWVSLELRHVTDATFSYDVGKEKWIVNFSVGPIHLSLPLTDPVTTCRLGVGVVCRPECLLTLSLTEPIAYKDRDLPELCYKLAATVIDI